MKFAPVSVTMHRLTLGFSDDLEPQFRQGYILTSLPQIRFTLLTGIFSFILFGLYDQISFTDPILLSQLAWIRYGLICPCLLIILGLSFTTAFKPRIELANQCALLLTGLGIIAINGLARIQDGYVGLILVLIYAYLLSKLRFIHASFISLILIAIQIAINCLIFSNNPDVVLRSIIFLAVTNLLGMVASYQTESYIRREFLFQKMLHEEHLKLLAAQEQSERLLLNILPESIATRLKADPVTIADGFSETSILFADIVNFTQLSSQISPVELVNLLNQIISRFDQLTEKHQLEKIKTIGDCYMVVAGIPDPRPDHAEAMAEMALDMQQGIRQFLMPNGEPFEIRIGINSGSVVAGVIGRKKFIYDLWGDTVNIASRMESQGIPGTIQVSSSTYQRLRSAYRFQERGSIEIKGRGAMETYFLVGRL